MLSTHRWFHNLPLISYLWRAAAAGRAGRFSPQYFIVELLTSACGLFYLEVVHNHHAWFDPPPGRPAGIYHWSFLAAFAYHAVLFAL